MILNILSSLFQVLMTPLISLWTKVSCFTFQVPFHSDIGRDDLRSASVYIDTVFKLHESAAILAPWSFDTHSLHWKSEFIVILATRCGDLVTVSLRWRILSVVSSRLVIAIPLLGSLTCLALQKLFDQDSRLLRSTVSGPISLTHPLIPRYDLSSEPFDSLQG